jgi:hypothetical protein
MPPLTELLATIMNRLRPGGEPGNAADAVQVWNTLQAKFGLLLGPLSTDLLFVRTLSEHAREFPWLDACASPSMDKPRGAFDAFALCLEKLEPADIVAVNQVLLTDYIAYLSDLIGERLVTRFLDSAFPSGATDKNI